MPTPNTKIRAFGRTDPGRRRKNNEDTFLLFDVHSRAAADAREVVSFDDARAVLLAVSDGMGGSKAGEIASAMVVDALRETLPEALLEYAPYAALDRAVQEANVRIRTAAQTPEREGMGATLTAALVRPPIAIFAEVGDSRAYVLRGDQLVQLTRDQTQVQYLVDAGIDSSKVEAFANKNAILQAVGRHEHIEVVTSRLELRDGDVLLLCSDGLTREVPHEEMVQLLLARASLDEGCDRLIAEANARGGRDNVTVVVASFEGDGFKPPRPDEPVSATFQSVFPRVPVGFRVSVD